MNNKLQAGPSSSSQPQSSTSRQSVTFADVKCQLDEGFVESGRKLIDATERAGTGFGDIRRDTSIAAISRQTDPDARSRNLLTMERSTVNEEENSDGEDDYSASASAIIQRRNSTRRQSRRKRRPSSPFNVDADNAMRRRSSAYTTSSGETIISMEDSGNQEQVFENLKLHKEVLNGVKQQPWFLHRKVKLVRQAKAYIRRHEGALQERLAQSRSTKDIIARISLFMIKKWQYFRRELINLRTWLVPWQVRIMEIESHFGSAVASYFIFLRWLFWINLVIAATLTAFVAIPEVLTANATLAGERKIMLKEESVKSKQLLTLWEFEGVLKYSPFFYGWYTNQDSRNNYRLPLAYFVTNLVVYTYSFVAILRKMAENSRLSKLTEKEDEYIFSWKLFTGWDFMIGNPETAHNRTASIVVGFKEALLEEAEKEKDERNWKVISMRIFVNVAVLSLLALSAYAVAEVVRRSTIENELHSWWRQNEITIVMSLITYVFPILFEILGLLENYHPRKQLRIQLARIMVLNLLNLYSLIFALFKKINTMKHDLYSLKPTNVNCVHKLVQCGEELTRMKQIATLASLGLLLMGNATVVHSHLKREISQPAQPIAEQEPIYLNPILDSTMYEDVYSNETSDENYKDYYSYADYDNYETTNTSDVGESYTVSYPEEETNTEGADDNAMRYDASSTVAGDFSTEPTTVEKIYDYSTVFLNKTTTGESAEESDRRTVPLSRERYVVKCFEKLCTTASPKNLAMSSEQLDLKTRKKLRRLCWETMFGQELAKLTVMDLILTVVATLSMDFFRAVFVRFMNNCWCWDLEKQFPQYGDFKIAENILHLLNNQGMVWMGMFFSPGLTVLNLLKLGVLMYLRSWAVLTCNVPHEVVFRASRSNNFYFALLLTMLFLCVLPVGYAIVWVEPSWHCGPFSGYPKIYNLATQSLINSLPKLIQRCLDYIASPGIIIPLIVLMTLIIYYMASLAGSLREANNDLKVQLRHERTEERRKLFKIAEKRQNATDTPLTRWKKLLPALPQVRGIAQKDDVQVAIGNLEDTMESERFATTNAEEDPLHHRLLSESNGRMQNEEEDDVKLNGATPEQEPISFIECTVDSQSSRPTIPEIQINNEEIIVYNNIEESVELSDGRDKERT